MFYECREDVSSYTCLFVCFPSQTTRTVASHAELPAQWGVKKHQRVDKEPASKPQSEATEPLLLLDTTFTTSNTRGNANIKIKNNEIKKILGFWSRNGADAAARPTAPSSTVHVRLQPYLSVHSSEKGQTATRSTRRKNERGELRSRTRSN